MTVRMRINAVSFLADQGETRHSFAGPLTVLEGPIGVGKTTLFEAVKFALGGAARLSPVLIREVRKVRVELEISGHSVSITRAVDRRSKFVECVSSAPSLDGTFPVARTSQAKSIGDVLMDIMGLPAAPTYSTKTRTSRISFANIWWYTYVEQRDIDRSIAHSSETYADPARRATFDLLMGLVSEESMTIRARAQQLAASAREAAARESAVKEFLEASQSTSRDEAVRALENAVQQRARAAAELAEMNSAARQATQRADLLREMVLSNRQEIVTLEARSRSLDDELQEREQLLVRLRDRRMSVQRAVLAADLLAPINFVVCPRCAQSLKKRTVPSGACTVCLQPEPAATGILGFRAESEQASIDTQQTELEVVIRDLRADREALSGALAASQRNLEKLENLLDARSADFVAPRLEAFGDASAILARSDAEIALLEKVMRQWDVVRDLEFNRTEVEATVASDGERLQELDAMLGSRKHELLGELTEEFRRLIERFGIPGITEAHIDPKSYLPHCNGVRWDHLSTGGIATALTCAYMVATISVALRRADTEYPGLLILDTPRKSIGEQNAHILDGLYRELDSLAQAYPNRLQVIVADNDPPRGILQNWHVEAFDYSSPAVRTVVHPGQSRVTALSDDAPGDWELVGAGN